MGYCPIMGQLLQNKQCVFNKIFVFHAHLRDSAVSEPHLPERIHLPVILCETECTAEKADALGQVAAVQVSSRKECLGQRLTTKLQCTAKQTLVACRKCPAVAVKLVAADLHRHHRRVLTAFVPFVETVDRLHQPPVDERRQLPVSTHIHQFGPPGVVHPEVLQQVSPDVWLTVNPNDKSFFCFTHSNLDKKVYVFSATNRPTDQPERLCRSFSAN